MVQVDIFWSYGIGAGLAVAAHRQIVKQQLAWSGQQSQDSSSSSATAEGGSARSHANASAHSHANASAHSHANANAHSHANADAHSHITPEGGAARSNITPEGGGAHSNITPEGGGAHSNITPEGGGAHSNITPEGGLKTAWKIAVDSPYFTKVLLFLGLIFVPSGFWLLWQFSSWETMHAGSRDLPVWLVGLFAITNVSQGVLGFVICHHLIRKGKLYAAWLNFIGAYFGMFFILVHGWDGKGYQRFFSPDRASFENWSWSTAAEWFTSDIAFTLYGMGVIFLPALGGMTLSWIQKGTKDIGMRTHPLTTLSGFLGSVLVFALGLAIICSIALMQLGLIPGFIASVVIILALTHKRWGLGPLFYRSMTVDSRLSA